ncbi:hypothetical protein BDN70DRAFT_890118 [Pholiota conissans]|uniref:Uncharacterized protein n=1 Tax=Pholiota conissans TaxID=109636 RepID=A0A9P5ZGL5_9AGAR|nr:hypothetical protein BDN70DRAFT_890118 [Pholiota conissans]
MRQQKRCCLQCSGLPSHQAPEPILAVGVADESALGEPDAAADAKKRGLKLVEAEAGLNQDLSSSMQARALAAAVADAAEAEVPDEACVGYGLAAETGAATHAAGVEEHAANVAGAAKEVVVGNAAAVAADDAVEMAEAGVVLAVGDVAVAADGRTAAVVARAEVPTDEKLEAGIVIAAADNSSKAEAVDFAEAAAPDTAVAGVGAGAASGIVVRTNKSVVDVDCAAAAWAKPLSAKVQEGEARASSADAGVTTVFEHVKDGATGPGGYPLLVEELDAEAEALAYPPGPVEDETKRKREGEDAHEQIMSKMKTTVAEGHMNSTKTHGLTDAARDTANCWVCQEKQMMAAAAGESIAVAVDGGCSDGRGVLQKSAHYILTNFAQKNLEVAAERSHTRTAHVNIRQWTKTTTAEAGVDSEMSGNATTMRKIEHGEGTVRATSAAAGAKVGGRNSRRRTMVWMRSHGSGYAKIGAMEAEDAGHDYDSTPVGVEAVLRHTVGMVHSSRSLQANVVDDTSSTALQRTWLESKVRASWEYFWTTLVDKPSSS